MNRNRQQDQDNDNSNSVSQRGFAAMDPQQQQSIASKGGLTAQAHAHGYDNPDDYQQAKDKGEVEFSKGETQNKDKDWRE
eukprot:ANDGO_04705.mRNA.1 hypothetical protein